MLPDRVSQNTSYLDTFLRRFALDVQIRKALSLFGQDIKKTEALLGLFYVLPDRDSNPNKQIQNLLSYH